MRLKKLDGFFLPTAVLCPSALPSNLGHQLQAKTCN